jgi:hypothetical protein
MAEEGLLLLSRLFPGAELGFWDPLPINTLDEIYICLTSFDAASKICSS